MSANWEKDFGFPLVWTWLSLGKGYLLTKTSITNPLQESVSFDYPCSAPSYDTVSGCDNIGNLGGATFWLSGFATSLFFFSLPVLAAITRLCTPTRAAVLRALLRLKPLFLATVGCCFLVLNSTFLSQQWLITPFAIQKWFSSRLSSHIQKLSQTVNFSCPSWQLSSWYRLVSRSRLSID